MLYCYQNQNRAQTALGSVAGSTAQYLVSSQWTPVDPLVCGSIIWTSWRNRASFTEPVYFPTTGSFFSIQLIIIPDMVSSDNSNQKQLEALVVNDEP